ncbi:hypothetical protein OG462_41145 [Streptomyces sp. NBC_01077]|uniref:hypothetical protein n=1 Tax=Streptomyces sp. NBC_01077 TaxID=2903746 RepID=UPI00386A8E3B|nr:hypothetical protein OG462_41145 [Streptomyces sp. NBC_01077]
MGLIALFRTPEYRNLPTLADRVGKRGCIDHCTATRVNDKGEITTELFGPGTALKELDSAFHRAIGIGGAALTAWFATRGGVRR